jgi:hypothetical protein
MVGAAKLPAFQAISTDSELPRYNELVLLFVDNGWCLGHRMRTDRTGEVYGYHSAKGWEVHRDVKFFCRLPPNPTGESI